MGSVAVPPGFAEATAQRGRWSRRCSFPHILAGLTTIGGDAGHGLNHAHVAACWPAPPTSAAQPPQTATGSGRVPATGMASPQGLCDTPTRRRADQRFALRLRPGRTR